MRRPKLGTRAEGPRARNRSFRGLPARITLFAFWATVITSLTITGISIHSIQSFLRARVDEKFPDVAARSAQRVELWYEQRRVEIGVFASNDILREGVPAAMAGGRRARNHTREVAQYLEYLLESFPQYEALFVLTPDGSELAAAGTPGRLSPRQLESALASRRPAPGPMEHRPGERMQLVSASLQPDSTASSATLHAQLDLDALDEVLRGPETDGFLRAMLIDGSGRVIASSAGDVEAGAPVREIPEADQERGISEYSDPEGVQVIGSAASLAGSDAVVVVEEPFDHAFAPLVSTIGRIFFLDLGIILVFGLAAYRISVGIVRPIEALSDAARRIAAGEREVVIPEQGARDEMRVLIRTFNDMTVGLAKKARELEDSRAEVEEANAKLTTRNDDLQRVNEILEQLSITDGLTQLHNHRFFQDLLSKEVRRVDRTGEPLALVLADVDHFKAWNDRLGHAGGDRILREVAQVLNDVIRETDLLARYGGEEFALLAPGTDLAGAVQLAEKMRAAVDQHVYVEAPSSDGLKVTLSFGVSEYRGDRDRFFEDADRALYAAKAAGRDCVCTADGETLGKG